MNLISKIIKAHYQDFCRFFFTALFGLSIDLSIFYFLTSISINPFIANCVSSISSVTVVYFISLKFIYKKDHSHIKMIRFMVYYFCSILFFSFIIDLLLNFVDYPIIAKIIIIPFSFICNYFAGRFLITKV